MVVTKADGEYQLRSCGFLPGQSRSGRAHRLRGFICRHRSVYKSLIPPFTELIPARRGGLLAGNQTGSANSFGANGLGIAPPSLARTAVDGGAGFLSINPIDFVSPNCSHRAAQVSGVCRRRLAGEEPDTPVEETVLSEHTKLQDGASRAIMLRDEVSD
jgi:hypothetical protein